MRYEEFPLFAIIANTIAAITGEDAGELFEHIIKQPLEIDARDYAEVVQHLEAIFDCTLHAHYTGLIDASTIVTKLQHITSI